MAQAKTIPTNDDASAFIDQLSNETQKLTVNN